MDPKELIERLNNMNWQDIEEHPAEAKSLMEQAAAALEDKQDALDFAISLNLKYVKELEQVKRERDAYEFCGKDLLSRGNCNDCGGKENCDYRPRPGETVRANCPLWRGPQKEE